MNWPFQYTGSNGKTYLLGCKCDGGVTGGFNTVNPVTRAQCDSISATSSVPEGSPESTVGPCGQVLVAASCKEYYNKTSINGIPIAPIPHNWMYVSLFGENIEIDPCDLKSSRFTGCVDNNGNTIVNSTNCRKTKYDAAVTVAGLNRYYAGGRKTTDRAAYIRDCHTLSNLLEAGGCCTKLGWQIDKPETPNDTGIRDTFTTSAQEDRPYQDIPITLLPGVTLWGGGGSGPGGGPAPGGGPSGPVSGPTAREAAGKAYEILRAVGVIGAGVLVGMVVVSAIPVLAGGVVVGGVATVVVIVYTGDGTAQVVSIDVPLGGT
jgi:hypothetical protein